MKVERRAWSWRQMLLKSSLPGTTRHVLLTLSCHVNDSGEPCYPSVDQLVSETGLSKQTVLTHLKEAKQAGWIKVSRHGFSGQKWSRNEYELAWPDGEKAVKEIDLETKGGQTVRPKAVKQLDLETGRLYKWVSHVSPNPPLSPKGDGGVPFERWWVAYPGRRKFAKAKCLRLWQRLGLDAKADQVMAALKVDVESDQWRKDDGQYVPLPYTWLYQERYAEREPQHATPTPSVKTCHCGQRAVFSVGGRAMCRDHYQAYRNEEELCE